MSKKNLIKSTGLIGLATATSRVLGFVRDIMIASLFGTAIYAQAFVVAFRIPNLLRDLIGEGATNSAFVPVLTDELTKKGKDEFLKLSQVLLNIVVIVLLVLTVLGVIASPLIVKLIAPGFLADQEKFRLTVTLTRMLFPFLLLVGLWAYAMGILNSLGKFASSAFGPAILNVSIIFCAMRFGENIFGLASGVLAGGALQFVMQFPSLYSSGWRMRFTTEFAHPGAHRIGILLVPRALGSCVYQVNVFISTILASLSTITGEGAVAALYYANRVWQLPLAIFAIALAQAALPAMSRHVALNDMEKLKETLLFSLKILLFILVPATVGLMVLSGPITKVLFERGAFTSYSTTITASALFFYAIGLVACGGTKVLVNAFYSLQDTMTPLKAALASLILNIILNIALMFPLKLGGLALGASIASMLNFIILYWLLEKRIGGIGIKAIMDSFSKIALASIVMAIVLKLSLAWFSYYNAVMLFTTILLGLSAFLLASFLLNVKELKDLLAWIIKRR